MSIALQVRILAASLVVATAALIGTTVFWGYQEIAANERAEELAATVHGEAQRLELASRELFNDVRVLAALPSIEAMVADGTTVAKLDALATMFVVMMRGKPQYRQLRLIGCADGGRELVRVDRTEGGVARVEERDLQQKGDRDYFREALDTPAGDIYCSAINLNRERGKIETPHRPTVRAGIVVRAADGQPFGIVLINLDFARFLGDTLEQATSRRRLFLANSAGDYLVHPDQERTFGFDLGRRHLVQDELPAVTVLCDGTANSADDVTATDGSSLLHFVKVHTFPDPRRYLLLGSTAPSGAVKATLVTIGSEALTWTTCVLLLALLAGWLVASRLAQPLADLAGAADRIAADTETVQLPTQRRDEIGDLARAFENMLTRLATKHRQIEHSHQALQRANEELEHFAHIASHDLREPARRMHGVADLLRLEMDDVTGQPQELLTMLQDTAARMLDQISDFRVFAKLAPGDMRREVQAIGRIAESVLLEHAEEIATHKISYRIDPMPEIEVYPSLVTVLYRNLVDNAMAHGSVDGMQLDCTYRMTEQEAVFGLRNTGSALTAEQIERLFAPFTRLTRDSRGPGLGLAICRRIVERHGGRIWVESGTGFVHVLFTLGKTADEET